MLDPAIGTTGRETTRSIWFVTLLGFGAGVLMLAIIYWTLNNIHMQREKLDTLQVEITRMITSLDTHLVQGREDLGSLLTPKDPGALSAQWVQKLTDVAGGLRTLGISHAPELVQALDRLDEQLTDFKRIRADCLRWNERNEQNSEAFPAARKSADAALGQIRASVISIEGHQRLDRALQIRHYRNAAPVQANTLARKIIDSFSQGPDVSTVKTELSDLALLCERLLGEDQIDDLADLKDNKFKSTLDRLRRGFRHLDEANPTAEGRLSAQLRQFETALFGSGFKVDTVHQTILPAADGLYALCRQRLAIRNERSQLQNRVASLFDHLRNARQQIVHEIEMLANQTAFSAERTLSKAWSTMLLVWLLSSAVYFIFSTQIARTVKRQIRAIQDTNESLKREIIERQRVETALRKSEEALRQAKDGLEIRVEERTSELRQANERLGREVAVRKETEETLRHRSKELSVALGTAQMAQQTAEAERDKSENMLSEVTEAKRRLEILISDATAREKRMVDLKQEVNDLLQMLGREIKYDAPDRVEAFLAGARPPDGQRASSGE